MRKIAILIGFMFSALLPSLAEIQYLSFTKGLGDAQDFKTIKKVTESDKYIDVTYQFEGAKVFQSEEGDRVQMENAHYITTEGEPSLPYYTDMFVVPALEGIFVEMIDADYQDYESMNIASSIGEFAVGTTPTVSPTRSATYEKNLFYPTEITKTQNPHLFRGAPLMSVDVFPVQFNPISETIRCYASITYRIHLEESKNVVFLSEKSLEKVENMVTNNISRYKEPSPQYRPGTKISYSIPENYVFVTIPEFETEVKEFAKWKSILGFNCSIVSKSNWTSDQVRDSINSFYQNNDGIDYLMIVGDAQHVPVEKFSFYNNTLKETITISSDKRYACINDSANVITDFSIGRVAGEDVDEIRAALTKIKNYEAMPPENYGYYTNGVHCAYFQDTYKGDNIPDGIAHDGYIFVETSENLLKRNEDLGMHITRIYARQYDTVMPQYYAENRPLPDVLLNEDVWKGDRYDLRKAFEDGVHYIFYNAHGSITGWSEPFFSVIDAMDIKNDQYPVVLSSACKVGDFVNKEGLAEALVKNPHGGAVGMVANTHYGWSKTQDKIMVNMFENLFNVDCQNSVADAMESALINVGEDPRYASYPTIKHARLSNHYFGDPSMKMYAFKPGCIMPVITQKGDTVIVETGIPKCQITLSSYEDPMDASKLKTVTGTGSAIFANVDYPYNISVKKGNYASFYTLPNQYIQDKIFETDSFTIVGSNVYVGNHVNPKKNHGDVVCRSGSTVLKTYGKIVLGDGFRVNEGAYFHAIAIEKGYDCDRSYPANGPHVFDNDPYPSYSESTDLTEELGGSIFALYPNPTDGDFTISFGDMEGDKIVSVLSVSGEMVHNAKYSGETAEISLSQFPSGIYVVRVITTDKVMTKRLILK